LGPLFYFPVLFPAPVTPDHDFSSLDFSSCPMAFPVAPKPPPPTRCSTLNRAKLVPFSNSLPYLTSGKFPPLVKCFYQDRHLSSPPILSFLACPPLPFLPLPPPLAPSIAASHLSPPPALSTFPTPYCYLSRSLYPSLLSSSPPLPFPLFLLTPFPPALAYPLAPLHIFSRLLRPFSPPLRWKR